MGTVRKKVDGGQEILGAGDTPLCLRPARGIRGRNSEMSPQGSVSTIRHRLSPDRITINHSVVVIPTYNECENIAAMIHALRRLSEPVDILVVDDNSPDGTAEVVEGLIEKNEGLYLLRRPGKSGLGSAYKAGFAFALRHGWTYICQMDADFSHDPHDVPRLIEACRNGADMAIGSRYVQGGRVKNWPWKRRLLSRTANLLARTMLRSDIDDMTAGFKCFRREALERIDLARVQSEGYIFQVEMSHLAHQEGLSIRQIPICFTDRTRGISKMGHAEARDGFCQLWRLRFLGVLPARAAPEKVRCSGESLWNRSPGCNNRLVGLQARIHRFTE